MPKGAKGVITDLTEGGVTAIGAGNSFEFERTLDHALDVSFSNVSGSLTALTIDLEGSIAGERWFSLTDGTGHVFVAGEITAGFAQIGVIDKTANYVRYNIKTLTNDTGTSTVLANYTPGRRAVD